MRKQARLIRMRKQARLAAITFRCSTKRERRGCVSRLDWPPSPLGARLIRPPSRGEERAAIERRGCGSRLFSYLFERPISKLNL